MPNRLLAAFIVVCSFAAMRPVSAEESATYTRAVSDEMTDVLNNHFRELNTGDDRGSLGKVKLPKLYCARGVDCDDKYVMLVFSSPGDREMCSGVMIAPDLVLTNRHCIAPVTTTPNSAFGPWTVTVSRPGAKTDAQARVDGLVGNLVAISPDDFATSYGQADWSILKLNAKFGLPKAKVSFPKLSREGFLDGHEYHIYAQSASSHVKEPDAVERRVCHVRYGNIFAARFVSSGQTVTSFVDCPIGPGNSGSPIYNEREELVGIIGGQMDLGLFQILNQLATKEFRLSERPLGFVGWGVNLACVPDLAHPEAELPPSCDQNLDPEPGHVVVPPDLARAAIATLEALPQKSVRFESEARAVAPDGTPFVLISQDLYVRVPKCVRPKSRASLTAADLDFAIPVTGVAITPRGELTDRLAPVTMHRAKLVANIGDLRAGRRTTVSIKLVASGVTLASYELAPCAE